VANIAAVGSTVIFGDRVVLKKAKPRVGLNSDENDERLFALELEAQVKAGRFVPAASRYTARAETVVKAGPGCTDDVACQLAVEGDVDGSTTGSIIENDPPLCRSVLGILEDDLIGTNRTADEHHQRERDA